MKHTLLSVLLAFVMLLSLASCGGNAPVETLPETKSGTKAETVAETKSETVAETVIETEPETKAPETKAPETVFDAADQSFLEGKSYQLTDGGPYYFGRWFEDEINGVSHHITLTNGSACYFLIDGASSFTVDFTAIHTLDAPVFAYRIDGGEPLHRRISDPTVELPDKNRHIVTVIIDSINVYENKWEDECGVAVKDIVPSDGGRIVGVKPTSKVIFFYGDSITEGLYAISTVNGASGSSATGAYPYFCAEKLNAVPYYVGYSGSGVICSGTFTTFPKTVDQLSQNRPISDADKPDMIVINHGTNDWTGTQRVFTASLKNAVKRLIELYPDTPIVYMIPFCQNRAESIRALAEEYENILIVETDGWRIEYTDTVHPTVKGAETAGGLLADAIHEHFGEDFFK